jgi:hypothetical protein
VRRQKNLSFIPEWEKVVTPMVDYLVAQPEVDSSRIGLMGYPMRGWLAVRAAVFEHRLAAVMAVDGVYNVFQAYYNQIPAQIMSLHDAGEFDQVNEIMANTIASGKAPIALRWGIEQGVWSFCADSITDFVGKSRPFTLAGVAHLVKCPAWIGEVADDIFIERSRSRFRMHWGIWRRMCVWRRVMGRVTIVTLERRPM